jgi:hypothetical protein
MPSSFTRLVSVVTEVTYVTHAFRGFRGRTAIFVITSHLTSDSAVRPRTPPLGQVSVNRTAGSVQKLVLTIRLGLHHPVRTSDAHSPGRGGWSGDDRRLSGERPVRDRGGGRGNFVTRWLPTLPPSYESPFPRC